VQYLSTNAKSAKKDEKALEILRARIATVSRALSISTKFGTFPKPLLSSPCDESFSSTFIVQRLTLWYHLSDLGKSAANESKIFPPLELSSKSMCSC
jgi:hypothetical protein